MGPAAPALTLGPFDVSTDRARLAQFAAATRGGDACVPATFPIVWLTHPAIRTAVETFARTGEAAFHEEQTFDYRAALDADTAYRLFAAVERQEAPARVVVRSRVERADGPVLTMRTVLRLIDVSASIADADRPVMVQQ